MQDNIKIYDLVIIGGGINGTGIAVDAAGRGLSVYLCEKDDLASHTSSASSKLIHGGLRYLEHKAFRLVREALAEREVLLSKAPHLIKAMRFILPHRPHLRPAWLIRTGLFFYDHLGKRKKLAGSRFVSLAGTDSPLKPEITQGFEYSDCTVDDSRLVVLNAMQAREKGADIQTRTRCIAAQREADYWLIQLENQHGVLQIKAKALVNATGAWVAQFMQTQLQLQSPYVMRLIQGSHIIVPRLQQDDRAFILQNEDQRIVFVIPYLGQYSLIGTTDREYHADPENVVISSEEIDYLLNVANDHFKTQLNRTDIIYSYSGVRPLYDDPSSSSFDNPSGGSSAGLLANPSAISRDYILSLSSEQQLPLLSVFGGKITTYRKLAEAALQQLQVFFPEMTAPWTATEVLPGAENLSHHLEDLVLEIQQQVPDVPVSLAQRWANAYGTRVWRMLDQASCLYNLGRDFGHGLYAAEVDYLVDNEWATQSDDILWRRSKLGLLFSASEIADLDEYLLKLQRLPEEAA